MPRYSNETADTMARRLARRMVERSVPDGMGGAYADNSAKDDTGTYFGATPRLNEAQMLMDNWSNRIYRDSSWLPRATGQVVIVPESLMNRGTMGRAGGFALPPGYAFSDTPTPPFTPRGVQDIPTVGVIVAPRVRQPGTPSGWRRGGIRPELAGVQPPIVLPPTR